MLVGYARISTSDQKLDMQIDALKKAGCEKIFTDIASGVKSNRGGLDEMMGFVRQGDTLVVWKLDRLGRLLRHLIDLVNDFSKRGVGFKSLQESLDTTTPGGTLIFHVMAAIAEFERNLIRERTLAGLAAARARGREGGRPAKLDNIKVRMALDLLGNKNFTPEEVSKVLKVHKSTMYRHLAKYKDENNEPANNDEGKS